MADSNPTKTAFYDPKHNGYDIGKRFLEDETMSPEDWRNFVISGEIVIFRDRLLELLRIEAAWDAAVDYGHELQEALAMPVSEARAAILDRLSHKSDSSRE